MSSALNKFYCSKSVPSALAILLLSIVLPANTQAQVLEEIVVTAQRREQSLQEVPISIETYSGAEIRNEGFRDIEDLGNFTPSVNIETDTLETQVRVRGFGTSGFALTLEQSVPTFLDGVIVSRSSAIKIALLDVASVEVLKGPQPAYFGQNAVAGAFNLRSARPTPEWEGYINGEVGSFSRSAVEAAIGGPITDTLGIRVAAKYDTSEGFVKDIVEGDLVGFYESLGGRVILEWRPLDNLTARWKLEHSDLYKLPQATLLCLIPGTAIRDRRGNEYPGNIGEGDMNSIWAEFPKGMGTAVQHRPLNDDCFEGDYGLGSHHMQPELHYRFESDDRGMIDIREVANAWAIELTGKGIADREDLRLTTTYLDLNYQLANGIELNSLTGWSDYLRNYREENHSTIVFARYQNREEDLKQLSQEFRLTSPTGGPIEWMAGVYFQKEDYDFGLISHEATVRRGLRLNDVNFQDTTWKSAFAMATFNFMDNKMSIDVGGRYSDVDKTALASGKAAQWVFDVFPCASHPDDWMNNGIVIPGGQGDQDPATCQPEPRAYQITAADTIFLLPEADTSNLWTFPYNRHRRTPVNWRGPRAHAIGITIPNADDRNNPSDASLATDSLREKEFNPQVSLRFRPTNNMSLYARYAEAFKAGGFDTAVSSIPTTPEEYGFKAEYADIIEVGAKGTFWDGRARYEATLFESNFTDLQLQSANPDPDSGAVSTNAGGQRLRGLDLYVRAALTDKLQVAVSGALLDSVMTDYSGARCTEFEANNPDLTGCDITQPIPRIDRTGQTAPYAPEWKFVFDVEYRTPLWNEFVGSITAKAYVSDEYYTNYSSFDRTIGYDRHEDLNLTVGIGDEAGTWKIAAYARNLFEVRPKYHQQYDLDPEGIAVVGAQQSMFKSFGIRGQYSF